jgi:signal recognition particle subunit SRP54
MFDSLQEKFDKVFKNLRIQGVLTEQAVDESLREVRLALLEADVHYKVVKDLLDRVRVRALGEEVKQTLTSSQEVVRIVRDELVDLLGGKEAA